MPILFLTLYKVASQLTFTNPCIEAFHLKKFKWKASHHIKVPWKRSIHYPQYGYSSSMELFCSFLPHMLHVSLSAGQFYKACSVVSTSSPHIGRWISHYFSIKQVSFCWQHIITSLPHKYLSYIGNLPSYKSFSRQWFASYQVVPYF